MTALQFNTYWVNAMGYTRNENFTDPKKKVVIKPQLKTSTQVKGTSIELTLVVTVGSLTDQRLPFEARCSITGSFTYQEMQDETKIDLDTLVNNNAVAILFPYARAIITMLTAGANEYPAYILPTINVNKALTNLA
ncbi:protein-export chaperone SecB [Limosilactobacillus kribbianus]|uniref:protein-export chaperone SecB n=1 Tax=Limosilactobacillus kribbianus TaxID=2982695 RepID=UPI002264287C|nr:protein-export chaperone SecB [Limosilactobacillus kribbianus]